MVFNGNTSYDEKDNVWPKDLYYVPTLENGGAYYVGQGNDKHLVVKGKLNIWSALVRW